MPDVSVTPPYPDTRKVGRDGSHQWLVAVKASASVRIMRFEHFDDAADFRDQDPADIIREAFA
jgi:hypothetical protein